MDVEQHSTAQHIFFFLRSRKKSIDGDDVACDFATYLISGWRWRMPMNETGQDAKGIVGCDGGGEVWVAVGRGKVADTHLHHQTDNKNHRHTADDVCMILNHEFVAQDRRILLVLLATEGLRTECIRHGSTLTIYAASVQ